MIEGDNYADVRGGDGVRATERGFERRTHTSNVVEKG